MKKDFKYKFRRCALVYFPFIVFWDCLFIIPIFF